MLENMIKFYNWKDLSAAMAQDFMQLIEKPGVVTIIALLSVVFSL